MTQWFVGVWFLFFPFSLFHDKSELVPIFSFSLVILCLIKTYFHPGFLAKQARMSLPMRFCFHYKRISICKRVYCTEQPMEQNSMPNRRSSGQQKWGHDNTWDLVEKKKWRNRRMKKERFVWYFIGLSSPKENIAGWIPVGLFLLGRVLLGRAQGFPEVTVLIRQMYV